MTSTRQIAFYETLRRVLHPVLATEGSTWEFGRATDIFIDTRAVCAITQNEGPLIMVKYKELVPSTGNFQFKEMI